LGVHGEGMGGESGWDSRARPAWRRLFHEGRPWVRRRLRGLPYRRTTCGIAPKFRNLLHLALQNLTLLETLENQRALCFGLCFKDLRVFWRFRFWSMRYKPFTSTYTHQVLRDFTYQGVATRHRRSIPRCIRCLPPCSINCERVWNNYSVWPILPYVACVERGWTRVW
jgi:hypothetical protein